jgi:hypothetical protein
VAGKHHLHQRPALPRKIGFRLCDAEDNVGGRFLRARQQEDRSVRACVVAAAMMLSGCSASELVQNWSNAPVSDLSEPNYRRIVAESVKALFPNGRVDDMEISGVRLVDHMKGQVWRTCLKLGAHDKPQQYAIFIQNGKIVDSRASIIIDQCGKEAYEPFDLAAKPGA